MAKPVAAMGFLEVQQPKLPNDAIAPKNLTKVSKVMDLAVKGAVSLSGSVEVDRLLVE
ncbi:hypothetical protein H9Q13_07030 [Pontibacter sp. JH31]|uniref:Uncharacterized protein n=1 Tax=Pontibacter aquaedesilientis TaxID=2766980 RepID=A0ABR7XH22_9BACT|nr:hypothetical protein [Pontibacter aquaedesilientis]MBD1396913.1 hypothetical protein [Pontibacter aquaedesilientis]